jgi:hypothetical protein
LSEQFQSFRVLRVRNRVIEQRAFDFLKFSLLDTSLETRDGDFIGIVFLRESRTASERTQQNR